MGNMFVFNVNRPQEERHAPWPASAAKMPSWPTGRMS
jgi:hypothetical protein